MEKNEPDLAIREADTMDGKLNSDKLLNDNDQRTNFKKFTRNEWNKIETGFDNPITLTVLEIMNKLGSDNESVNLSRNTINCCGDEIYLMVRPYFVEIGLIPEMIPINVTISKETISQNKHNKKHNPGKLTKDEIKRNNTIRNIEEATNNLIKTFSFKHSNSAFGFREKYAELRFVTLIYCAVFFMKNDVKNMSHLYELILGIEKTLKNVKEIPNLSKIAYEDLSLCCKNLKNHVNFSYGTMFDKFPRLCIMTTYDNVFHSMAIKPYESQKKLMDNIKKHKAGLFLYNAMISTGKTTMSIALSKYVETLRTLQKASGERPSIQLIFACSVEPVRLQVCKMAYNQKIPFGIAISDNNIVKITNNFSCKNDDNRILIVADVEATIGLLSQSQDYVLFVDEPTVGADQINHPVTRAIAKIMLLAPKLTILSSGTLPNENEMGPIIDYFKKKHSDKSDVPVPIISICSKEALIGCEIINFDGSTIAPHNNCCSRDELKKIIDSLKTRSFIDRMYTAPLLYKLRQKMIDNGIKDIVNLEDFFHNVENLSQSNIQKLAIQLLEKLSEQDTDELVQKICVPLGKIIIDNTNVQTGSTSREETEDDIIWEPRKLADKFEDIDYDLNKILTTQAYKYLGNCLIAVNDPIKFAFEQSLNLFQKFPESAAKLVGNYKSALDRFNQALQKLDTIKNETKRSQQKQNIRKEQFALAEFSRLPSSEYLFAFEILRESHD